MVAGFVGMFAILLCIDMGIKQYIEDTFDRREERKCIVPGIVLRKVYNRGFLLSTLEKYPGIVQGASAVTGVVILFYDFLVVPKEREMVGENRNDLSHSRSSQQYLRSSGKEKGD